MHVGLWPAITLRQIPPSFLPRQPALAANECGLWLGARDPEARKHHWQGHLTDLLVVEVDRRGKLLVGEPYFVPNVPVTIDRKGSGDIRPGDLVVVRTGRGRARTSSSRRRVS